jgi:glyoxylase-like metal-dependent hydrolase (beta-lactamase superfamily II)
VPAADAIFVGDGLTTRHVLTGEQGPQQAPFTDDPEQALASLSRLEAIEATWLLPGHGTPWNGKIPEAVRAIRAAAEGQRR